MYAIGADLKPDPTSIPRSRRNFIFFSDLDRGLGKAEDVLIKEEMRTSEILHLAAAPTLNRLEELSRFHIALRRRIDKLHGVALEQHSHVVELSDG